VRRFGPLARVCGSECGNPAVLEQHPAGVEAEAGHVLAYLVFSLSGGNVYPAGTLCNFTLDDTFTVEINFAAAPNGANQTLLTENNTHTNVDTGYALTEVDHVNQVGQPPSSTSMQVGIFWHLRGGGGSGEAGLTGPGC
jgi:hypothetical protein